MDLVAAIDLLGGAARRLEQGDYERPLVESADPLRLADDWLALGLRWLHVIDLDGARDGQPVNTATLVELCRRARATGARVEAGGGLRDVGAVGMALEAGADIALLGSAAIRRPDFAAECVTRWPGRIGVSLDLRGDRLAVDGWRGETSEPTWVVVEALAAAGVDRFNVTDIQRDGTNAGPNLELAGEFRARYPDVTLLFAGGIATTDDLRALARLGVDGAIVGRALLDGSLSVAGALAACAAVAA